MDLAASLDVVLDDPAVSFAPGFYQRLFESHPELKQYFAETDFHVQQIVLTNSLIIVGGYAVARRPAMRKYLELLGHRHALRGISVEEYPKFHAVMLAQLATYFGAQWTLELSREWDAALAAAIRAMRVGHAPGAGSY